MTTTTIERMTGATMRLVSTGSNVRIIIEGNSTADDPAQREREKASQVAQAITLLFNYRCISWPDWYDSEAQASYCFMDIRAGKDSFERGYLTLVYAEETTRNGKHDFRARVMRAGRKTIAQLREMFSREDYKPMPDMSCLALGMDSD